jgi:hypothetical protein
MWLRRHWPLVVGGAPWLLQFWHWVRWALEWGEHTDYIAHHLDDLKWFLAMISEPPGWLNVFLLIIGGGLIWWDLKRTRLIPSDGGGVTTSASIAFGESPKVTTWLSPREAIGRFVDHGLVLGYRGARQQVTILANELDEVAKILRPPTMTEAELFAQMHRGDTVEQTALRDKEVNLRADYTNANLAEMNARKQVLDNLISKLRNGFLIGRAVLSDSRTLHDDWEYIKPAHWVVLTFETRDNSLETITGAGKTYKGLQIGKPEN